MPFYESSRRPKAEGYRRLQFIVDVVGLNNLGYDDVAAKLGLTKPTIYSCIREDDMSLSRAEDICELLGFDLHFSFVIPNDNSEYVIDGKHIVPDKKGKFRLRRLAFLSSFLKARGVTQYTLGEKLGLAGSTVAAWFQRDDIKISRLFQIADAYGYSVRVDIENHVDEDEEAVEGRTYQVNIIQRKVISID